MKKYQAAAFKWRHFHGEVILQCLRWYCKDGISYRDLEEMMSERGLKIDHTTLYRWVQRYAPELKKKLDWYKRPCCKKDPDVKKANFGQNSAVNFK